jgi:hypothetical protein
MVVTGPATLGARIPIAPLSSKPRLRKTKYDNASWQPHWTAITVSHLRGAVQHCHCNRIVIAVIVKGRLLRLAAFFLRPPTRQLISAALADVTSITYGNGGLRYFLVERTS